MKKRFKPGETVPRSGQYKNTGTKREVTAVKGEPFPPTPDSGQEYVLVDKTKHKR
ncbi:MAG: YjzC family protein [Nitrospinae bacterium]|nr:YjzC family protein [Nitrospinota bacterium]